MVRLRKRRKIPPHSADITITGVRIECDGRIEIVPCSIPVEAHFDGDDDVLIAYRDALGGIGVNMGSFGEFHYFRGSLPNGWPERDDPVTWRPAGPYEGTNPQLLGFLSPKRLAYHDDDPDNSENYAPVTIELCNESGKARLIIFPENIDYDDEDGQRASYDYGASGVPGTMGNDTEIDPLCKYRDSFDTAEDARVYALGFVRRHMAGECEICMEALRKADALWMLGKTEG
jgi:hypothetical protein